MTLHNHFILITVIKHFYLVNVLCHGEYFTIISSPKLGGPWWLSVNLQECVCRMKSCWLMLSFTFQSANVISYVSIISIIDYVINPLQTDWQRHRIISTVVCLRKCLELRESSSNFPASRAVMTYVTYLRTGWKNGTLCCRKVTPRYNIESELHVFLNPTVLLFFFLKFCNC